jgi:hypothetical protein
MVESMRVRSFLFLLLVLCAVPVYAQREQQIPQPVQEAPYSRRFFTQLRGVFGRFRDSDLQRAFDTARPIQCSQLVNEKGEWRTVAFINERRELGDWYRSNFEEVKSDVSVFIFSGICRGERGPVQLTTKFPVTETLEAYNDRRIPLEDVEVNVNAPVRASFNSQTQAYSFDLPYLFLVNRRDDESVYSLDPPLLAERNQYATDVINHWDCKSVAAEAVTYQFLICRTMTVPSDPRFRDDRREPAFGASAYFILSDGTEASSDVKLTFTDESDTEQKVVDASVAHSLDVEPPAIWETPDPDEKVVNLLRNEFKIQFDEQSLNGKSGAAQVLSAGQLTSLAASNLARGVDYCVWFPGSATSATVEYSVTVRDANGQTSTSISLDMRTPDGLQIGKLECSFPRTPSAASIAFSRWESIVGEYVTLQVKP